ncbi:MAG: hypothetical protein LBS96_07630, partial [Oscillospiraceae bacterium]|nr:hypothetical protein [Oscillospiraceae bacterium]
MNVLSTSVYTFFVNFYEFFADVFAKVFVAISENAFVVAVSEMFLIPEYAFIRRAMLVGVLVSLCAALLGVSLVLKRYS